MPAGSGRSIYTRGLGSQEKKFKTATFFKDLLSYILIQWGFTEKFLIMKLLRSDGCFTVTLAALFRKHKLPLHSSVSSTDNYNITKVCSSNITSKATPVHI